MCGKLQGQVALQQIQLYECMSCDSGMTSMDRSRWQQPSDLFGAIQSFEKLHNNVLTTPNSACKIEAPNGKSRKQRHVVAPFTRIQFNLYHPNILYPLVGIPADFPKSQDACIMDVAGEL